MCRCPGQTPNMGNMERTSEGLWVEKKLFTTQYQHWGPGSVSKWAQLRTYLGGDNGWNERGTENGGYLSWVGDFYRYIWDCELPGDTCAENSVYECNNVLTTQCSNKDGTVLNDVSTCKCGDTTCDILNGMYCIADTSTCTWTTPCENRDGTERTKAGQCTCGTDICESEFCSSDKDVCSPYPVCENTRAFVANRDVCRCGEAMCDGSSGLFCSVNDDACFETSRCQNQDGTARNGADCSCGLAECTTGTGRYCLAESSSCSLYPPCDNTNGLATNADVCACGNRECSTDDYCWLDRYHCSEFPDCQSTNGVLTVNAACTCNTVDCSADDYCWFDRDHCSEFPDCQSTNGTLTVNAACTCNTADCSTDDYCWFDRDHCSEFPDCQSTNGLVANPAACTCGVAACVSGQYCNDGTCQNIPVCVSGLNDENCTCGDSTCTTGTGLECLSGTCRPGACVDTKGNQSNVARCQCHVKRDEFTGYPVSSELGETGKCPDADYISDKETCQLALNNSVVNEINDVTKPRGCFEKSGIAFFNVYASTVECEIGFARSEPPETCMCFVPLLTSCEPGTFCSDQQCNNYGNCPHVKGIQDNDGTCMCAGQECSGYCLEVLGQCRATANAFTKDGLSLPVCQSTNETCLCGDETNICRPTTPDYNSSPDSECIGDKEHRCKFVDGWCELIFPSFTHVPKQGEYQGECDSGRQGMDICTKPTDCIKEYKLGTSYNNRKITGTCDGCIVKSLGLSCDSKTSKCSRPETCSNTIGDETNSGGCQCGSIDCSVETGFWCRESANKCSSDGLYLVTGPTFYLGDGACKSSAWLENPQRPFTAELKWNKKCATLEAPCPVTDECGTREAAERPHDMNDDWLPKGYGEDSAPPLIGGLVGYDSTVSNFMYKNTRDSLNDFGYNWGGTWRQCDSDGLCCANDPQNCLNADMKTFLDGKMKQQCVQRCKNNFPDRDFFTLIPVNRHYYDDDARQYDGASFRELRCLCVGGDNQCTEGAIGGTSYSIEYEEFPPLLTSGDDLYNSDRVEECGTRCNNQSRNTHAWFTRKSDERCACVGEDNDCSEDSSTVLDYKRYGNSYRFGLCADGLNNDLCLCGSENTICRPTNPGLVCDIDTSTCSRPPNCADRSGVIKHENTCKCGSTDCSSLSGFFCHSYLDTCLKSGRCLVTNGTIPNTEQCICDPTLCQEKQHCLAGLSQCSSDDKFKSTSGANLPACQKQDGVHLNEHICLCNENVCQWNDKKMTCLEGSCQRPPDCRNTDGTVKNMLPTFVPKSYQQYMLQSAGKCTDYEGWGYITDQYWCNNAGERLNVAGKWDDYTWQEDEFTNHPNK